MSRVPTVEQFAPNAYVVDAANNRNVAIVAVDLDTGAFECMRCMNPKDCRHIEAIVLKERESRIATLDALSRRVNEALDRRISEMSSLSLTVEG